MIRWVFRPYAQVWRTICTSVSLRTSTRVSPGFFLPGCSSSSFGSQHAYSNSYHFWCDLNFFVVENQGGGVCVSPAPLFPHPFQIIPLDRSLMRPKSRSRSLRSHVGFAFGFFAPSRSHACRTPWSVLQDGTIVSLPYRHPLRLLPGESGPTPKSGQTKDSLLTVSVLPEIRHKLSLPRPPPLVHLPPCLSPCPPPPFMVGGRRDGESNYLSQSLPVTGLDILPSTLLSISTAVAGSVGGVYGWRRVTRD